MCYNKVMKAMGIDFGLARIGIALSDDTKFLASPFITYKRKGDKEDVLYIYIYIHIYTHTHTYVYTQTQ